MYGSILYLYGKVLPHHLQALIFVNVVVPAFATKVIVCP
jgi:hypothetical protein